MDSINNKKQIENLNSSIDNVVEESFPEEIIAEEEIPTQENNTEETPPAVIPNDYYDYPNIPFISVDFRELLKKNNETVGFIRVEGTKVNYPFVQTTNNDFYLKHSYDKSKNRSGWIFGDFRNNMDNMRKNTIIYGHNLSNKTLFGTLTNVLKADWYKNSDNHFIKISTLNYDMVWQTFSVYTVEPVTDYLQTVFTTDAIYENFITMIKGRSIYNFNVDVRGDDKILTLSTCANGGKKRAVLHAKLVNLKKR